MAEAASVAEVLAAVEPFEPDVMLMDVQLPDGSGIEAIRATLERRPNALVIMLTMTGNDDAVFAALAAGARGYLLKGADRKAILAAVAGVDRGEAVLGAGVAERVLAHFAHATTRPTPRPELTERERQILRLIAQGTHQPGDRPTTIRQRQDGSQPRVQPY